MVSILARKSGKNTDRRAKKEPEKRTKEDKKADKESEGRNKEELVKEFLKEANKDIVKRFIGEFSARAGEWEREEYQEAAKELEEKIKELEERAKDRVSESRLEEARDEYSKMINKVGREKQKHKDIWWEAIQKEEKLEKALKVKEGAQGLVDKYSKEEINKAQELADKYSEGEIKNKLEEVRQEKDKAFKKKRGLLRQIRPMKERREKAEEGIGKSIEERFNSSSRVFLRGLNEEEVEKYDALLEARDELLDKKSKTKEEEGQSKLF